MRFPWAHQGKYGLVTLDLAACGSGFVVEFVPDRWAAQEGHQGRWETFQGLHTAQAYFWALTGLQEAPRGLSGASKGRAGVKGSRRPALAGRGQPLRPVEPV